MKNKLFNICNLYTFLWIIMNVKFIVYESNFISVAAYVIIVAISLYYAAKCYASKNNPDFIKAYNVLFAVLCIYGAINMVVADVDTTYKHIPTDFYLQNVVKSMLPFYAFYSFAKDGYINRKWICVFCGIFIVLSIGQYFVKQDVVLSTIDASEGEITNNYGYLFVALLPLVIFYKKMPVKFFFLSICAFFIVSSMKRGANLSLAIMLLILIGDTVKAKGTKKWFTLFFTAVILYVGYFYIVHLLESNAYFVQRIDDTMEGNSSNRDYLYSYYWRMYWDDSSFLEYVIGRGADGTIHTGHNFAHNDWLEILINQGMFGIVLFGLFWLSYFKLWKKTDKNEIKLVLALSLSSLFLKTFFSMSINEMSIYSTFTMAIGMAAYKNESVTQKIIT